MHAQIRWVSNQLKKVDIKLLIFLVLLLNVKLLVKVLAIVFIYALKPDFKFGFSIKKSRVSLLYPFLILLALINAVAFNLFEQPGYWLVFLTGSGFWIACLLVSHQAGLFAEENKEKVFFTLQIFFILNALVSLAVLAGIMLETGSINPYTYQGDFQKYFIGTGDYIKGISFDTSTANAAINAFGVFLFLEKKKWGMLLLCLGCLLLTGSNLVNFLLLTGLLFLFIFILFYFIFYLSRHPSAHCMQCLCVAFHHLLHDKFSMWTCLLWYMMWNKLIKNINPKFWKRHQKKMTGRH